MATGLDAVMAQYEKNKNAASSNTNKISQEDRLKRYFTTILPKGVKSANKKIRILPTKDGSSPFVEVYFHELQVDGQWVKLFDPAQEGKRSPLNEVRESLLATGDEMDKELAKNYRSRKFYIVKVIDRDNEQDGPKFWRFKSNFKNMGVYDKIIPIFTNKGWIVDPENGRDLTLSLVLDKAPNGKEYTTISTVIPEDKEPLHADKETSQLWENDELTWNDVYSKKPEDYLELVAKGEVPQWDNDNKKWKSNGEVIAQKVETAAVVVVDPQADEAPAEDLPF